MTLLTLYRGRRREAVESRSTLGSEEVVELDLHLLSTDVCYTSLVLIESGRRRWRYRYER
jgi:hypothetical protein